MKKFILKLLVITGLFLILNILYLRIIQKTDWNFSKAIEIKNFQNQEFDCLVLGNSLALDGIDTSFLTKKGISSYNLAIGGASLKTNFLQLKEYLKLNKQPTFVILGLSSCLNLNFNSEDIHPIIETTYNTSKNYSFKDLPLLKFKWLGTELLKKLVSKNHRNATMELGQLKISKIVPDVSRYKDTLTTKVDLKKYSESIYLTKIDSLCKINVIQLIALEMPGFKNTQNLIPSIIPKNSIPKGLGIINLNNHEFCSALFNDSKDWLGNSHLNVYGAKKLTDYLYEQILLPASK